MIYWILQLEQLVLILHLLLYELMLLRLGSHLVFIFFVLLALLCLLFLLDLDELIGSSASPLNPRSYLAWYYGYKTAFL